MSSPNDAGHVMPHQDSVVRAAHKLGYHVLLLVDGSMGLLDEHFDSVSGAGSLSRSKLSAWLLAKAETREQRHRELMSDHKGALGAAQNALALLRDAGS